MKIGAAVWGTSALASASFLGFSGGMGVAMIGFALGTVLFAPGIALAYILPLLPFIHFLFAVFGWLLAVIEAVIEVPIFALAHLDPEGEGVLPQVTRSGYMLLLHLILRPLLIICGVVVSIILMNGMVDFLNLIFDATVLGVEAGTSVDIFSELVYTVIYAALAYAICNACCKTIDHIPNTAMRWIGAQGDHHESSGHVSHATGSVIAAGQAAQTIGQAGPQAVSGITRSIGSGGMGIVGGLTRTSSSTPQSQPSAPPPPTPPGSGGTGSLGPVAANAAQLPGDVGKAYTGAQEASALESLGSSGGGDGDGTAASASQSLGDTGAAYTGDQEASALEAPSAEEDGDGTAASASQSPGDTGDDYTRGLQSQLASVRRQRERDLERER